MKSLLLIVVCLLLLAFAPVPVVRPMRDPDRAIEQFGRQAQVQPASADHRKRRLLGMLEDFHGALVKGGRVAEAEPVRDLIVLVESIDADRPLGEAKPTTLVRKAAVEGKYRHLLHAIYVPTDQANYTSYQDFGYWNGTTYGGQNNLQAGYWVYVFPRWFIWREGPGPRP